MRTVEMWRSVLVICLMVATAAANESVSYSTFQPTIYTYRDFISSLRKQLMSGNTRYDVPLLRTPSAVTGADRFLLVGLSNMEGSSITLGLDVTNAKLAAVGFDTYAYFLSDAPKVAFQHLFRGRQRLSFNLSTADVEVAGVEIGDQQLDYAILNLPGAAEHALPIIVQMTCHAAKFPYVERRITFNGDFLPDAGMLSLEKNWVAISRAIQEANHQGLFKKPVELQRADTTSLHVSSVTSFLVANIALMPALETKNRVPDHWRPVSVAYEPVVASIGGYMGLCVEGNGINGMLWLKPCVGGKAKQQWVMYADGSIRPRNKRGLCVTIDDKDVYVAPCITGSALQTWWFTNDGTLESSYKGLVIDVQTSKSDIGKELFKIFPRPRNGVSTKDWWLPLL